MVDRSDNLVSEWIQLPNQQQPPNVFIDVLYDQYENGNIDNFQIAITNNSDVRIDLKSVTLHSETDGNYFMGCGLDRTMKISTPMNVHPRMTKTYALCSNCIADNATRVHLSKKLE
jgi:hypothetical protein